MKRLFLILCVLLPLLAEARGRRVYTLDSGWQAVCFPEEKARYGDSIVQHNVQLPHNFDDYFGARQLLHGNLHGDARYDIEFSLPLPSMEYLDQMGLHQRSRFLSHGGAEWRYVV